MPAKEKNVTSVWRWMWIIFVQAMPCIGFIMSIIWAFTGTNESRKNYFKAHLAWLCIVLSFWLVMVSLGFLPTIRQQLKAIVAGDSATLKSRARGGTN